MKSTSRGAVQRYAKQIQYERYHTTPIPIKRDKELQEIIKYSPRNIKGIIRLTKVNKRR